MATRIAASEAKAVLGSLIRQAEAGEDIELTRYGRTVAVIVSAEKRDRLQRQMFTDSNN